MAYIKNTAIHTFSIGDDTFTMSTCGSPAFNPLTSVGVENIDEENGFDFTDTTVDSFVKDSRECLQETKKCFRNRKTYLSSKS